MTQENALKILQTGANVFLTGAPGSGKTHTVRAYINWLRDHDIEPAITASTGVAATHIHGLTLHAWSGIGITDNFSPQEIDRIASKEPVVKRIQKTKVLIIDEVSMLSAPILDAVDAVCRQVRGNDLPFGGMQIVLVGDFFQLPPIVKRTYNAYGTQREAKSYFSFESAAWQALHVVTCYLTEQHRQDDGQFLSLLGSIRSGSFAEDEAALLQERYVTADSLEADVPRLYTHNIDVDRLNDTQLGLLPGNVRIYTMESSGSAPLIESLKRGCLSPDRLTLKEGAVVMCTKNSSSLGYANGTIGKIVGFEQESGYPIIETLDERTLTIPPTEWIVEEDGKIRARISQIPLRLAWAITIHKSQGQSLDAAAMDLSRAFEYGQGYVALSRVRTLEGLYLLGWSARALAVHPLVESHDHEFQAASEAAEELFGDLEEKGERTELEHNFIKACGGTIEIPTGGRKKAAVSKQTTYEETLGLLKEGKTLEEIVDARKLTFGTICDHLEKLAASNRLTPEEVRAAAPKELMTNLSKIGDAFTAIGYERLGPVFFELDEVYTYDELKLARVLLRTAS